MKVPGWILPFLSGLMAMAIAGAIKLYADVAVLQAAVQDLRARQDYVLGRGWKAPAP
jgi:hypothetical protein